MKRLSFMGGLSAVIVVLMSGCGPRYSQEQSAAFLEALSGGHLTEARKIFLEHQSIINPDLKDDRGQSALHYLVEEAGGAERLLNRSQGMINSFLELDDGRLDQLKPKAIVDKVKYYNGRMETLTIIIEYILESPDYSGPPEYLLSTTNLISPEGMTGELVYRGMDYRERLLFAFYFFHGQRVDLLNDHLKAFDEFSQIQYLMIRLLMAGAEKEILNEDNKTPLQLAKELGADQTAELLAADTEKQIMLLTPHVKKVSGVSIDEENEQTLYNGKKFVVELDYGIPHLDKFRHSLHQVFIREGLVDEVSFMTGPGPKALSIQLNIGREVPINIIRTVLNVTGEMDLPVYLQLISGKKDEGRIVTQSLTESGEGLLINDEILKKIKHPRFSKKKLSKLLQE